MIAPQTGGIRRSLSYLARRCSLFLTDGGGRVRVTSADCRWHLRYHDSPGPTPAMSRQSVMAEEGQIDIDARTGGRELLRLIRSDPRLY